MYSPTDPRAALNTNTSTTDPHAPIAALATYEFLALPPDDVSDLGS